MRATIFTFAATALIAVTALPAAASSKAAADSAVAGTPASNKAEEKVCKRPERSGTRLSKQICLTKEEWKKIEKDDY
jgi:Spy/CpxP family protein refolding chaperone